LARYIWHRCICIARYAVQRTIVVINMASSQELRSITRSLIIPFNIGAWRPRLHHLLGRSRRRLRKTVEMFCWWRTCYHEPGRRDGSVGRKIRQRDIDFFCFRENEIHGGP
jgi:hypothetical protein